MTESPVELRDPASVSAEMPGEEGAFTTIVVCSSCRLAHDLDADPRPGALLARQVAEAAQPSGIAVKQVACLGNCNRGLSAALVRDGAWQYVFGGLELENAADLVAGAELLNTSDDGRLPWSGRPAALKGGLVARIPPLKLTREIS